MKKKLMLGLAALSLLVAAAQLNHPLKLTSISAVDIPDATPAPDSTTSAVEPIVAPIATPTPTPVLTAAPTPTATPAAKYISVSPKQPAAGATIIETDHVLAYVQSYPPPATTADGTHKLIQNIYSDGTHEYTLPDGTPFNYYLAIVSGTW